MIRFLTLILVVLVTTSTHAAMQFDEAHQKLAQAAINEAIEAKQCPGAVLLIGTKDGVIFEKAYGNRAVAPEKLPMTVDTIFDMASVSKSVGCATSVMVLASEGKLSVKDPIVKFLPQMNNNGKEKITIEQCLLHRAGFVADNPMKDYENGPGEALKKVYDIKLKYEPESDFIYSDVSFIVLGEIVKAASGEPLDEFAKKNVFEPLGMKDSTYNPPKEWLSRIAPTEKRKDGTFIHGTVHDPRASALGGVAGHAGMFSTAQDIGRWCRMILNEGELDGKRIMSAETVREMTTKRCLPSGKGCRGYGVDFATASTTAPRGDRFEKGTTFGHTGWTGTLFWIDPKNKCFFVLLTNRNHPDETGSVTKLRNKIGTIVGEALLGAARTN